MSALAAPATPLRFEPEGACITQELPTEGPARGSSLTRDEFSSGPGTRNLAVIAAVHPWSLVRVISLSLLSVGDLRVIPRELAAAEAARLKRARAGLTVYAPEVVRFPLAGGGWGWRRCGRNVSSPRSVSYGESL